jgi:CBS domain-containing protein
MAGQKKKLTLLDRQVRSFMVKKVKTVEGSTPLISSLKVMRDVDIGCVVVTEKSKPVGIFTERDLVRKVAEGLKDMDTETSRVMTSPLITTSPIATVSDVVKIMQESKIRRLPVTAKDELAGIVTERDVARLIFSQHKLLVESAARSILFDSY